MFSHKLLNDFMYELKGLPRAQSQYLSAIKKIYTDAEKDYDITPFSLFRFDVPRQKKVGQRALDVEILKMIFGYQGTGIRAVLARDCCVLSFALCGINSVDLYEAPRIKGKTLCYDRQKTKDRRYDNAHMEINVLPQIKDLVNKYKDTSRAFSFYKRFSSAGNFNTAINKGLKAIHDDFERQTGKPLPRFSFYAIRHTWASIARNELGIEKSIVHEALAHIERDTAIDDLYIKKDYRLINDANKKVVDFILPL
jgi:integrase